MLPVIAIVGRPNVGKSTLFNRITSSDQALVANLPGVTRDRIYGQGQFEDRTFIAIDTGGLGGDSKGLEGLMEHQSWLAIKEADVIFFVVDARSGLTATDEIIANKLRAMAKPIYVVINKAEGWDETTASNDFYQLGLDKLYPISAAHNEGIASLMETVFTALPKDVAVEEPSRGIKLAIVGRPNVGKSTLVNRMLGEERVIVYDSPGTTRDSIYIPFQRHEQDYTLIDTAGVRRRRGITETIEKFSVIKTLQAIETANVVIMVLDGQEGITEQDLRLIGFILETGRALILAINKWDNLPEEQRAKVKKEMDRRLDFVSFAEVYFISALHGTGVGDLFTAVQSAYKAATRELSTPELTDVLEQAVEDYQPPVWRGHPIKLRYAHAGGHNPPVIVIHGKRAQYTPESYRRYLANYFREKFHLVGTPVRIILKGEMIKRNS